MGDRRLERIKTIAWRHQRVPAKRDDDGPLPKVRTVDFASFGPVGSSLTEVRFFHLATVFWFTP
jgi:hypothetical protein